MSERIEPKNHAEAVALFRAQILGAVTERELERGELSAELERLSACRWLPPGQDRYRRYAVATLERWYYRYRAQGLTGLEPRTRKLGHALSLNKKQRGLIRDIAEQYPRAPVSVIVRTLQADGRLELGTVSVNTVRRFLVSQGLDAAARRHEAKGSARKRWAKAKPGELWHADVCHGPNLTIDGKTVPTRVLGILDDASRFVVGLRVFRREREADMLALFVEALRTHGRSKTLYLDNGSTFRGDILRVACGRLGIQLVHAQPYDPQARGKMERFWRTLRQGCLDHVGACGSHHDVQARLLAFLDQVYLPQPHGALFGKCPAEAYYAGGQREHADVTEDELRDALTVRQTRRVAKDGTVPVGGIDWEVDAGYLAGRKVTVGRTLLHPSAPPWVEHEGHKHMLCPVDPVTNARTPRKRSHRARGVDVIPFDPAGALLDKSLRRAPKGGPR